MNTQRYPLTQLLFFCCGLSMNPHFPLLIIPAITASSVHFYFYFMVGMLHVVALVKAFNADDRVVFVLALQASKSVGFGAKDFSTDTAWSDLLLIHESTLKQFQVQCLSQILLIRVLDNAQKLFGEPVAVE